MLGQIVSKESATIGLPGDVEYQVLIDAVHGDMCRYDLSIEEDEDMFRRVRGNVKELYRAAIRTKTPLGLQLPAPPQADPRATSSMDASEEGS